MTEQVFVARERELAQLQTFLEKALAGQGQVPSREPARGICFVTGEAGAGKTALVTEFARRAQDAHADPSTAFRLGPSSGSGGSSGQATSSKA